MTPREYTRRQALGTLLGGASLAVAGCTGLTDRRGTPTPQSYTYLSERTLFVAKQLSLSVPASVERTSEPADADVVVLPAATSVPTTTVVDWLAAGTYVALVGSSAESTYLSWRQHESYADEFGAPRGGASSGAGGGSGSAGEQTATPQRPDIVVAWRYEDIVTTYRVTYGNADRPTDRDILAALDHALDPDTPEIL